MTGNDDRHILLLFQPQQHITDFRNPLWIQTVDRLIQNKKIRFSHKRQPNP